MQHFNHEDLQMEFPCDFPIKVVGVADEVFELRVYEIAQRHDPAFSEEALGRIASKSGKYNSLTLAIRATSKEQLSAIYQDLQACELVLWAL